MNVDDTQSRNLEEFAGNESAVCDDDVDIRFGLPNDCGGFNIQCVWSDDRDSEFVTEIVDWSGR